VAEVLGAAELEAVLGDYGTAWTASKAAGEAGAILLDPGTEAEDLAGRAALASGRPFLRVAAGLWPSAEALADPARSLAALEASIAAAGGEGILAAIGEGGLDYFHREGPRLSQLELFEGQVELARKLGKPMTSCDRPAGERGLCFTATATVRRRSEPSSTPAVGSPSRGISPIKMPGPCARPASSCPRTGSSSRRTRPT
jgi:hypothetical protein